VSVNREEPGLPDLPMDDAEGLPADEGDVATEDEEIATPAVTPAQREAAKQVVLRGARLMLAHIAQVHYTQGTARWQGIKDRKLVKSGQFPTQGDCSSIATWLLWNALHVGLDLGDVVNGRNWAAGFTGTMLQHGRAVPASSATVGDLVIYGTHAPGVHVAVSIGGGMVFSHGSEAGPFKLRLKYRPDVLSVRRYF
jgi:hypothetical protein